MSLEKESERLREIPLFRDLDSAKRKLVAMSSDRLRYAPGDAVFLQGAPSDSIYFMLSGRVEIIRERNGSRIVLAEAVGGAVLGEIGVICGKDRSASVVAIEETSMLRTDARVFKELLQQVPQAAIALARELAIRLDLTSERLLELTYGTSPKPQLGGDQSDGGS